MTKTEIKMIEDAITITTNDAVGDVEIRFEPKLMLRESVGYAPTEHRMRTDLASYLRRIANHLDA